MMEDNKNIQRQSQVIIAYGLNNIGCDQRGATFQTVVGMKDEHSHSTGSEHADSGQQQNDAQPMTAEKPRGPRKKFLFILDGIDTKENEEVKSSEKERLCSYLGKHCLRSRKLVCTKDDTLNKTIVCFLRKWIEKGLTAEEPSGGAVFRFLTEDCGIMSEVLERAYGNRVKEWIKDKNGYDTNVMLTVKEAFK